MKARIGFAGSLTDFFQALRTDPKFKYPNDAAGREAYLADARAALVTARLALLVRSRLSATQLSHTQTQGKLS